MLFFTHVSSPLLIALVLSSPHLLSLLFFSSLSLFLPLFLWYILDDCHSFRFYPILSFFSCNFISLYLLFLTLRSLSFTLPFVPLPFFHYLFIFHLTTSLLFIFYFNLCLSNTAYFFMVLLHTLFFSYERVMNGWLRASSAELLLSGK